MNENEIAQRIAKNINADEFSDYTLRRSINGASDRIVADIEEEVGELAADYGQRNGAGNSDRVTKDYYRMLMEKIAIGCKNIAKKTP